MKYKLLNKIVRQDYNNKLENVLSQKEFPEDVKNLLLSMFYKIENGYDDYKIIKRNTFDKKDYIEKLIKIIKVDCKKIEFFPSRSKEKEKILENEIYCSPIETKVLYCLAKIQKRSVVVNYLDKNIEEAISFVLNTGNNINMVEPLRDFNGFSWNVITKEIESLNCNILYQNFTFIAGNQFIDKWVNNYEPLVDYFDLFQEMIEKKFGLEAKQSIIDKIIKISILEYALNNEEYYKIAKNKKEEEEQKYMLLQDSKKYLINLTEQKKQKRRKIKELDIILNNKELLANEYKNRNKNLSLEKKIFSARTLKEIIKKEREQLVEEILNINQKMYPLNFIKERENTKKKLEYFKGLEVQDLKKEIYKNIINLQKDIIKCMYIDLKSINKKSELIEYIYIFRYYNFIPISSKRYVCNIKELSESLNKLTRCIFKKAIQLNIITKIFKDEELNLDIFEKIILSKIICFEKIQIQISEENKEFFLRIFDEEIEEGKIKLENITKEKISMRINKKVKLFEI